jgi:hypothetical protein
MKNGLLFVTLFFTILLACSKDKFQTKPQLKFISKNTDVVAQNGTLRITLGYTDKEGDVDDSLLVVRERLNRRGPVILPASPYMIPKFPDITKGEFEITLTYQFGLIFGLSPIRIPGSNPARNEPDTLSLKFVARDKAGNKSDTLTVSNIFVNR